MPTCFVIQPFDKGAFDKRYDDVFDPAIRAAELEPYRVDRDPSASIPVEQIEAGIRSAQVCLADITADNPNVWFELGFALSANREVVMVCAASRERFPFDIQHRSIIVYRTESSSDFEDLSSRITDRLRAIVKKETTLGTAATAVSSPTVSVHGLKPHELVTLVCIAQNVDGPEGSVSTYHIRKDMERAGYTNVAVTLGLASLSRKGMISSESGYDEDRQVSYTLYKLESPGWTWLDENQHQLTLEKDDPPF
jgi:hypothetical protein